MRTQQRVLLVLLTCLATIGGAALAPASAATRVTPGSFTGYAFDATCTPTQAEMDAWRTSSPFWGVGVYIGGAMRTCAEPDPPVLTSTWVTRQSRRGWRVLPIWVGPQAACTSYAVRIDPTPADGYAAAQGQGRVEAGAAVQTAKDLGIPAGSTVWYDIEDFSLADDDCRRSALSFLSAWTKRVHALGFRSGVYSNVAAAIHALDYADAVSPGSYAMPDQIWYAWANGREDTAIATKWVRETSWRSARVHQYDLDSDATFGGVTLSIDRSFMQVGRGSVAPEEPRFCGVRVDFPDYRRLSRGSKGAQVKALQCLLKQKHRYDGRVNGRFDRATYRAVRSFQSSRALPVSGRTTAATWIVLLSEGSAPVLKFGSAGNDVRRLQRALNVATNADLRVTGVDTGPTTRWVRAYQCSRGLPVTGVVTTSLWAELGHGRR